MLCIFCGAVGKSAQLPLHVWLPDAMEGPTPVSALIHAATMVAAGVYMLFRVQLSLGFEVFEGLQASTVIAWTGGITALVAALMAIQQDDIKRVLAYSTLSQLGYMVMAVGLVAGEAGMFHLFTHAWFKALLFLGSGAVIHACHHEQDIWKMGGLLKKMPITGITFLRRIRRAHRRALHLRILLQGTHPRSRPRKTADPLLDRRLRRGAHAVLHDPPVRRRLPRQGQIGKRRPCP